jgi:hypothetical protein
MTTEMSWRQTSDTRYEVGRGDTVVAAVTRTGVTGTKATGETPKATYSLRRADAFRFRVTVTRTADDQQVAVLAKEKKTTTVRLDDGSAFVWSASRADGSRGFAAPDGHDTLVFGTAPDGKAPHGTVTWDGPALREDVADVLLLLGLFLIAQQQSDDDATVIGSLAAVIAVT